MANLNEFFQTEEDERGFALFMERFRLEVYPVRVPADWKAFRFDAKTLSQVPLDCYLAASDIADVLVDKVKRGPDKGHWRVDEVRSPVIYYERSRLNDEGELLSGKLWAELDVTPQTGRKQAAADQFRQLVVEVEAWLKKAYRGSEPKGFRIGPIAARKSKEGLVLRESKHRGGTVVPYK